MEADIYVYDQNMTVDSVYCICNVSLLRMSVYRNTAQLI